MSAELIRFGTSRFRSLLSPDQLLLQMQQLTTPKRWLRNPFASVEEPFEGEVDASGFEVTPLPYVRSSRPIPLIRGSVLLSGKAGGCEISLALIKPTGYVVGAVVVGCMALLLLTAALIIRDFFLSGFAILLGAQLFWQRIPHQRISRKALSILEQRLQLMPVPEQPVS